MAETPAFVVPDAQLPDGSEHVLVSQNGNVRRMLLSDIANLTPAALKLPTVDPHVSGALWNNNGTVSVSAG